MFLDELCAEVRNYFVNNPQNDIIRGEFNVSNGSLACQAIGYGQYYRILGSRYNDGIHKHGFELLDDEEFAGEVWLMSVPRDFIALAHDIEEWNDKTGTVLNSPYTSESFGGYTYSKPTGTSSNGGIGAYNWKNQFATRLSRWRKVMPP